MTAVLDHTEDNLLAAVITTPYDDVVRLVYADFLEERDRPGDAERAELIRVQIEAVSLIESDVRGGVRHPKATRIKDVARHEKLELRARDLLACQYCLHWHDDLIGPDRPCSYDNVAGQTITVHYQGDHGSGRIGPYMFTWSRGFIIGVLCAGDDWVIWGDELRRTCPLTWVSLTTWPTLKYVFDGGDIPHKVHLPGRDYEVGWEDYLDRSFFGPGILKDLLDHEWPGLSFDLRRLQRRPNG